jgi:hypothetical protein
MAQTRANRFKSVLLWTVTAAFIGFALLLPANLLWRARLNVTHNACIRVFDGSLVWQVSDGSRPMPLGLYYEREVRPHVKWDPKFASWQGGAWEVRVPLVIPAVLFGGITGALWWAKRRERRRLMIGHCRACGYDLKGLAASACPECGAKIQLVSSATPAPAA